MAGKGHCSGKNIWHPRRSSPTTASPPCMITPGGLLLPDQSFWRVSNKMQPHFPIRRWKNYPRWPAMLFFGSILVTLGLCHWFPSYWFWLLPCIVWALGLWHQKARFRCPKCHRPLSSRTVRLRLGETQRSNAWDKTLFDCAQCSISWDADLKSPVDPENISNA